MDWLFDTIRWFEMTAGSLGWFGLAPFIIGVSLVLLRPR